MNNLPSLWITSIKYVIFWKKQTVFQQHSEWISMWIFFNQVAIVKYIGETHCVIYWCSYLTLNFWQKIEIPLPMLIKTTPEVWNSVCKLTFENAIDLFFTGVLLSLTCKRSNHRSRFFFLSSPHFNLLPTTRQKCINVGWCTLMVTSVVSVVFYFLFILDMP